MHTFFLEWFLQEGKLVYLMAYLPGTQSFSAVLGKRSETCEGRDWEEEDGEREDRAMRDQTSLTTANSLCKSCTTTYALNPCGKRKKNSAIQLRIWTYKTDFPGSNNQVRTESH